MKVVKILGDHAREHCGCAAVMNSLSNLLAGSYDFFSKEDRDYDILIVNGEGSMHHGSKNFKIKMDALQEALDKGKQAYLINTVWQKNPNDYDEILKNISGIIVREEASRLDLLKNHGVNAKVRLDISLQAKINKLDEYINFHGTDVVTDFYSSDFGGWVKYSGGGRSKLPYLDMKKFTWSQFVMSLETAGLLITGRHHAVFAACRAKTPFVALESNTHKISGFVKMSKIPIPVCMRPKELTGAIKWAKENKNAYSEFFAFLEEQPKFTLQDIGL